MNQPETFAKPPSVDAVQDVAAQRMHTYHMHNAEMRHRWGFCKGISLALMIFRCELIYAINLLRPSEIFSDGPIIMCAKAAGIQNALDTPPCPQSLQPLPTQQPKRSQSKQA
ncbi:hypothetical protein [Neisseria zoodegmatis]|uniref:Phage associated protein n=1 Tax=Neisseria zoodegmatis TaxID=326523 RepID=A0ABX3WFB1_9NEIS|nr:hypothetical protein [Neisseria zoodegmatis]OSI10702.1 hypothetical protein BWD10_04410 [Neisseria zoodegmatis]